MFTGVFGKNVAVLTTLVALVCNVPLKRKILFHVFWPRSILSRVYRENVRGFPAGTHPPGTAFWVDNITCRKRRRRNHRRWASRPAYRQRHKRREFQRACRQRRRQNRKRQASLPACRQRRRQNRKRQQERRVPIRQ